MHWGILRRRMFDWHFLVPKKVDQLEVGPKCAKAVIRPKQPRYRKSNIIDREEHLVRGWKSFFFFFSNISFLFPNGIILSLIGDHTNSVVRLSLLPVYIFCISPFFPPVGTNQ